MNFNNKIKNKNSVKSIKDGNKGFIKNTKIKNKQQCAF